MNPKPGSHREPAHPRIWLVDPHTKHQLRAPIGWPGFVLLSSHFLFCCVFIDEPHFVRRRSHHTVALETGLHVLVLTFISDLQKNYKNKSNLIRAKLTRVQGALLSVVIVQPDRAWSTLPTLTQQNLINTFHLSVRTSSGFCLVRWVDRRWEIGTRCASELRVLTPKLPS